MVHSKTDYSVNGRSIIYQMDLLNNNSSIIISHMIDKSKSSNKNKNVNKTQAQQSCIIPAQQLIACSKEKSDLNECRKFMNDFSNCFSEYVQ